MQFPYGISIFQKIITSDSFYVDRTDRIPLLERGKFQLELQGLRLLRQAMDEAREQVRRNREILNRRYGNLRLRGYAVVSLGFERIWWEVVGK